MQLGGINTCWRCPPSPPVPGGTCACPFPICRERGAWVLREQFSADEGRSTGRTVVPAKALEAGRQPRGQSVYHLLGPVWHQAAGLLE